MPPGKPCIYTGWLKSSFGFLIRCPGKIPVNFQPIQYIPKLIVATSRVPGQLKCYCLLSILSAFHILKRFYLFLYFWMHPTACGIPAPQPGIKHVPPALEVQSLNHWTAGSPIFLCSKDQTQPGSSKVTDTNFYSTPGYY